MWKSLGKLAKDIATPRREVYSDEEDEEDVPKRKDSKGDVDTSVEANGLPPRAPATPARNDEVAETQRELRATKEALKAKMKELEELKEELSRSAATIARLEEVRSPTAESYDASAEQTISELRREIEAVREENEDIKQKTQQYGVEVARAHEATEKYYQGQIASIMEKGKRELHEAKLRWAKEKEAAEEDLMNMMREANGRVAQLTQERDDLLKRSEAAAAPSPSPVPLECERCPQLETQLSDTKRSLSQLQAEVDTLQQRYTETQRLLAVSEHALEDAKTTSAVCGACETAARRERELSSELATMRDQLQTSTANLVAAEKRSSALEESVRTLQASQNDASMPTELEVRLQSEQDANGQLKQEVDDLRHDFDALTTTNANLLDTVKVQKERLTNLDRENQRLEQKAELMTVELNRVTGEQQTSIQELEELRTRLEDTLKAKQALRAELDAQPGEEATAPLREQIDGLSADLDRTRSTLAKAKSDFEKATKNMQRYEADIAQLRAEHDRCAGERDEATVALRENSAKMQQLEAEIDTIRAEADDRAARLAADNEMLTQELQQAVKTDEITRCELEEKYEAQVKSLISEVNQAKAALNAKDSEMGALRSAATDSESKYSQCLQDLESLRQSSDKSSQLSVQLHNAEEQIAKMTVQLQDSTSRRDELSKEIEHLNIIIQDAKAKIQSLEDDLANNIKGRESSRTIVAHSESTIKALTATNGELEEELKRVRQVMSEANGKCCEALLKIRRPGASKSQQPRNLSDAVGKLIDEYKASVKGLEEAEQIQRQWEQTYEQAREVNASSNTQLQQAWKQLGELREELSLKELALSRSNQHFSEEKTRVGELEMLLAARDKEKADLQDERDSLREKLSHQTGSAAEVERNSAATEQLIAGLKAELHDREVEAAEAQKALENLQVVLQRFQEQRQADIEDRTNYLTHEIDALRAQLSAEVAQRGKRNDQLEQAASQHRKELAQKNMSIAGLQNKLSEMRRVLEETAEKLNDDHQIDKRIVSHLLVNYIHSTVSQRGDTEDQVRVMSGLLNWDDEMMERAGLIPGSQNPKPATATSLRSAFTSLWGGGGGGGGAAANASSAGGKGAQSKQSLSQMWVDFLLKESSSIAEGEKEGQEPVADDHSRAEQS